LATGIYSPPASLSYVCVLFPPPQVWSDERLASERVGVYHIEAESSLIGEV